MYLINIYSTLLFIIYTIFYIFIALFSYKISKEMITDYIKNKESLIIVGAAISIFLITLLLFLAPYIYVLEKLFI